ncbi:condensation domain-containing protein, partial [Archangium sp.]|uniref:condensation domain-containing protein n=1 Tax=Archangium sp. TaxID=1872627 RepID=UPI002D6058CC
PKGVGVPHRAVSRLVLETDYAHFGPEEVWLQLAPISFDASTLEVWGALLHGAKLVVYPAGMPSLEELGRILVESGVTSLWLTAGLFEQMQAQQPEALGKVRQVLAGGDVLPVGRVRERLASGGVLINGYGPTENTTFSTCYRMEKVEQVGATVSIGRPIANTTAYVLDEQMQPVPVGVPGELYVGGEGLAVGYVGQPELTAERFVPHPFSGKPGERLYRTGDVVRYLPGGELEFIGRRDAQVKIRGFRIELGEVEAALAQHPAVSAAAVVVREDVPGNKRLVAYVVPEPARDADAAVLRTFLKERLPEYMVPAAFVSMEVLPLTPNGKVDRRALPAPEEAQAGAEASFVAPRSPGEELVAGIWAQLLGVAKVGVHDNFFELGGHSLLAMQVLSRLRETFRVELPVRSLFEAPTVAGLARSIESALEGQQGLLAPPLVVVPREGEMPASFAQQRLWFLEQFQPGGSTYNVPMVMHLRGRLDVAALERSLRELIQRHETLRTTCASPGGRVVQVISPEVSLELEVEELKGLAAPEREAEARRRAREEAQRPFELSRGPLLRAKVLRLEREEHVLVLVMHHIVTDGWS